jgi:predicted helicase
VKQLKEDCSPITKLLFLPLNDKDVPTAVQKMITNGEAEIKTDDLTKLIGTVNALSKQFLGNESIKVEGDESPMKRAVAFCGSIANSTNIAASYNLASENYLESLPEEKKKNMVTVQASTWTEQWLLRNVTKCLVG